jgi:hypothetical protein
VLAYAERTMKEMNVLRKVEGSVIITQTPLRISFAGGGTDLAAYYAQREGSSSPPRSTSSST